MKQSEFSKYKNIGFLIGIIFLLCYSFSIYSIGYKNGYSTGKKDYKEIVLYMNKLDTLYQINTRI